jgi:hypothetical protein
MLGQTINLYDNSNINIELGVNSPELGVNSPELGINSLELGINSLELE